jgi:hypothetical protein
MIIAVREKPLCVGSDCVTRVGMFQCRTPLHCRHKASFVPSVVQNEHVSIQQWQG